MEPEKVATHARLADAFIFIGNGSVSYVSARKTHNEVLGLRVAETGEGNALKSTDVLNAALESLNIQKEYQAARIVCCGVPHMFVPEPLFVGEKAASYLQLATGGPAVGKVISNRLSQKNTVSVFRIEEGVAELLRKRFPEAALIHHRELELAIMHALSPKEEADKLFLFISRHSVDIGCLRNGSLYFLNTFPYESDTDIVYFLLSVIETLKLNPDKMTVCMCGEVNPNGSLPALIKKYIPHPDWLKRPQSFAYPASFREFAEHQHYLEICSLLCAS